MKPEGSLEIKYVSPDQLELAEDNPKIHTDYQIDVLAASITRLGFNDPIGVDENMRVLEGNARLLAARKLGLTEIPILVVSGLTDDEKTGYAIAHNQTGMNTDMDRIAVRGEFADHNVSEADYAVAGYDEDDVLMLSTMFDHTPDAMTDHNGHIVEKAVMARVFVSKVAFNTQAQAEVFSDFVRKLRAQYGDNIGISACLILFMKEYGGVVDGY